MFIDEKKIAIVIACLVRIERKLQELADQCNKPLMSAPVRLFNASQASVWLGRSVSALRQLVHKREIPVVRVGSRVHFDRQALDNWIIAHSPDVVRRKKKSKTKTKGKRKKGGPSELAQQRRKTKTT